MLENEYSTFKILDIIEMKRKTTRIKTLNKSCYVLSCRLSGESTFFNNNKKYTIKQGDVLYIPFGASYYQECKEEEIVAFHLSISGNPANEIQVFTPDDPDKICSLFSHAASVWNRKTNNYVYHCMSDLYEIVAISNITARQDPTASTGVISESIRYLHAHLYDEALSLDTVYKQSYVSQTSFIKYFREIYGCSPIKYINQMRIQKAKILLKSSIYTREEIASLCGFGNVKHFYVVFKKITGMTTSDYLKNGKAESIEFLSNKEDFTMQCISSDPSRTE